VHEEHGVMVQRADATHEAAARQHARERSRQQPVRDALADPETPDQRRRRVRGVIGHSRTVCNALRSARPPL
jgi:hypothetical protein